MRQQEWQLWLSFFWIYLPLLCLKQTKCLLCNSDTLWNILMVLSRNVEQDERMCQVQGWQFVFLLALSPFFIFDSDYSLILCQLCKSNTLQNIFIFIILVRNGEQDETTCWVQEWQLWLFYFWSYYLLFCFWNRFRVRSVTQIPFRIFWWYLVEM